jgi:adenosylmethionine-8-amino-7-oxononanoate aminotransferase
MPLRHQLAQLGSVWPGPQVAGHRARGLLLAARRRDNLLANVRAQGAHLSRRLKERFGNHPFVGDVRGRGLFQALQLVADRGSKQPFDPRLKLHARVKREAMARGLMVYPMGGTADGQRGDHVLLAPPFIVDAALLDTIVERLGEAIDAATGAAD